LDHTEKQTPEHDTNESKKANKWPKVSFLKGKVYHAGILPYKEKCFWLLHTHQPRRDGKELTKLGEATSNSEHKV
jgi:hypothetical protein